MRTAASVLAMATCLAVQTTSAQEVTDYVYDAKGRLVGVKASKATNPNDIRNYCYDSAGNRTVVASDTSGAFSNCSAGGTPTPSPTPSPTPAPSGNNPPTANADSATVFCNNTAAINLTNNDTDAESDIPLVLTAFGRTMGTSSNGSIVSASSVNISATRSGMSTFTYTVADSRGATATGTLTVSTPSSGCFD